MAHVTLTLADVPPPPKPLHEDDHFSLVAESLPHPTIPNKIQLTSSNFYHHIVKFSKTVIVFCVNCMYTHAVVYIITAVLFFYIFLGSVRCKVFLHYVAAAHKQLNQGRLFGMMPSCLLHSSFYYFPKKISIPALQ